ncbi:MAG: cyclomaltodextrinase N-terminal domain-containing protein, partial [Acidobacteria bacterium]|nr:cyclomaltodextrinase N-terminal domain-containing protein [Acidobacteriota bacterium]
MPHRLRHCIIFLALLTSFSAAQGVPKIQRIDPPNWWAAFEPQVMLMLTGEGLGQATVTSSSINAHIVRTQPGLDGKYLFVWLDTHSARPGNVMLTVRTNAGTANRNFPILPRHDPQGLYSGVTPDDVIYLIMPDRFADGNTANDQPPGSTGVNDRSQPKAYHGGDLLGIRQHLGYLHDLGVTTLWLTPVWKNSDSDYHGYHVVDFYAIDDHMGTLRDYHDLVADAHKLGIKVLIDYVVNHVGPNHPWAAAPPAQDWFHGTTNEHLDALYKFDGIVDPHASAWESRRTLDGWFANKLPDLNPENPLVAQYALDNALWWMEIAGLDAFRLDTFPYSSRRFWSGWNEGVFRNYPHTTTIGEVWDSDVTITSFFPGGRAPHDGIDTHLSTVFDFPLYFAIRDVVIKGQPVQRIIDTLERDWLYPHPERLVTFIGNHDTR